jgi:hypothetical protein
MTGPHTKDVRFGGQVIFRSGLKKKRGRQKRILGRAKTPNSFARTEEL